MGQVLIYGAGGGGGDLGAAYSRVATTEYTDSLMGGWWKDASDQGKLGAVLNELIQDGSFGVYKNIKSSAELFANADALNAFLSSQAARHIAFYSLYCVTEIAADSTAFAALITDIDRLVDFIQSVTACYEMLLYEDNATALAYSAEAMEAIINNDTALNAIINSTTAMEAIANNAAAMEAIINNATALDAAINSSVAMEAIANGAAAMEAIANEALTTSVALDTIIQSGVALYQIAKVGSALEALAGIPTTTWEANNAARYTTMQGTLNAATAYFTATATEHTTTATVLQPADLRGTNITLLSTAKNTYASTYLTGLTPKYTGGYAQTNAFNWGTVTNKIYWGGVYYTVGTTSTNAATTFWEFSAVTYTPI